jgi:hypothetical protein
MFKKLIVFAITSGLAAKMFKAYKAKKSASTATAVPMARTTAPRYTRRTD